MAKLINFKDKGKWGYYNTDNHNIIPAQFKEDSDFVNGFAIVKQYSNSCYGVINEDGKEILPFIFSSIERQDNGLFKVGSYYLSCLYNSKGEIVDANGIALDQRFQEYDMVKPFGKELYLYKKGKASGVFYQGKVIVEKEDDFHYYVEIEQYPSIFRLKENNGNSIYYDYSGKLILPETKKIDTVSSNFIIFSTGYYKGVANAKGVIILPANYDEISYIGDDLFVLIYNKKSVKYNAKKNSFIVKNDAAEIVVPRTMEWCGDFENGKAIFAIDNKYGIIDSNFNTCVACDYEEVTLGYDNTAIVEADGKFHLLDCSCCEKKATYEEITHLANDYFLFKKDGYYGVIDKNGSIIIQAHYDKNIELLDDGNFRVSRNSSEKNYCIIDRESHIIVLTSKGFRHLDKKIIWVNNFSEGLAIAESSQGLKGAIDEQGNIVIPLQFKGNLSDFRCGYATHLLYCGNFTYKKEKIDIHGQVVPSMKEEDKSNLFSDCEYISVAKLCDNRFLVQRKEDNYFAIIDRENNIILPFSREKYMPVKKDTLGDDSDDNVLYFKYFDYHEDDRDSFFFNKLGNRIIPDTSGYVIINPNYRQTRSYFSEGLAAVSNDDGLWGFVNKKGQEQIPCIYDEVHDFNDGYCVVRESNSLCLIDKTGKLILSGDFQSVRVCKDDMFIVTHDWFSHKLAYETTDDYGFPTTECETIYDERKFNRNGEIVIPFCNELIAIPKEYEWCDDSFHDGFLSVYKKGKWGVLNTRLELVVECIYNEPLKFQEGVAIAKTGNVTVVLNTFHTLFWGDYSDIKRYKEFNLFVCKSNQGCYDVYNGFGILLFSSSIINSRIQIPGTTNKSSNRFSPSEIIPIDNNFFKFSCNALYEKRHFKKWGICGLNGEIILEACYDVIGGMGSGLVSVAKVIKEGCSTKLWGYINLKGDVVIDYKYMYAQPFSHGLAQISYKDHSHHIYGGLGLVATNGKELTDFVYEKIEVYSKGEMLAYYQYNNEVPVRITEQGAIHYEYHEDETCKDVYLYGYDWCSKVYHGLCVVMKGRRYGIIEASGTISFPLSEMGDVKIAVNQNGFVAFNKQKDFMDVTKEGRIITYLDGNKIELPVGIHWCEEWTDGYIAIESNGKWGLLNTELEFVLETKYESIQCIENKRVLCCSKENDKESYSIYSIETDSYLQLPYDDCSHFESGYAIVSKVIKEIKQSWTNNVYRTYAYGLIDYLGHELLPCEYSKIQFKEPIKYDNNFAVNYEEPNDWKSDYRDAFEDEPGATWGREW